MLHETDPIADGSLSSGRSWRHWPSPPLLEGWIRLPAPAGLERCSLPGCRSVLWKSGLYWWWRSQEAPPLPAACSEDGLQVMC